MSRGGKKLSAKFIRERINFEMLGREILNRAPKGSTGIYITNRGIQYGKRTNAAKYPENFIPFDNIKRVEPWQ